MTVKRHTLCTHQSVVAVLSAVIVLTGMVPDASAAPAGERNCRYAVAKNYDAPLERLPALRHPPMLGKLPFASKGVSLMSYNSIVPGAGPVGFYLTMLSGPEPAHVGRWNVAARLYIVDRKSRRLGKRGKIQRRVVSTGLRDRLVRFRFPAAGRPAIYRVDIVFRDVKGKLLGRYGKYFRVVPRRNAARLTLAQTNVQPGDRLVVELSNMGTTRISYGADFAVDKAQEGRWVVDPFTPSGFPAVGLGLFGGMTEVCRFPVLPPDFPPGHYRYRKSILFDNGARRDLAAEFFVD